LEKVELVEFKAYCLKQYYYIYKQGDTCKCTEKFMGIPDRCRGSKKLTQEQIIEHLKANSLITPQTEYDYKQLRSKKHEIYVVDVHKTISATNDKQYWIDDTHTLAWDDYRIPK